MSTTIGRAELAALASRFTDALGSGRLGSLTERARVTVNGQPPEAADLERLAGPTRAQPPLLDPDSGNAVVFATVHEPDADEATIVGARLQSGPDGDVIEAELLVSRDGESSIFAPARLVEDHHTLLGAPLDRPGERDRIVAAADRYFTDLQDNTALTVFHEQCQRIENGFQTTGNPAVLGGSTCAQQLEEGWFGYIEAVRGRRYPVVDTTSGVVMAVAFLDVPGTATHLELRNGRRLELPERMRFPRSTLLFEQFKVEGDELVWIEALMVNLPDGAPHGWE
ncbi:MAG: hypothetical protein ACRBI6_12335 [Acidimicrobiales bacterium]